MSKPSKLTESAITILTTIIIGIIAYLASSFFDGFVTKAEYNEALGTLKVIDNRLQRIEQDIKDIKTFTKKPL